MASGYHNIWASSSFCTKFICLFSLFSSIALVSSSKPPTAMETDLKVNSHLPLRSQRLATPSSLSLAASPPAISSSATANLDNYFICDPDRLLPCASMGNEVLNGRNPPKTPCCPTLRGYLGSTFESYAYRCIRDAWSYYQFGDAPWEVANRLICAAYYYCEAPTISKLSCEIFPIALPA